VTGRLPYVVNRRVGGVRRVHTMGMPPEATLESRWNDERPPFRWGRRERLALFGLVFVVVLFVVVPVVAMLTARPT
jgi:hypothetical protein